MTTTELSHSPHRITDLLEQRVKGGQVSCFPEFEILPVDFLHKKNGFKAYVFLCRFSGEIDGETYSFRKCYARGCPNNLCAHVSQAVMIANRYLQRDYHRLSKAAININEKLFTLEDMIVKFDGYQEQHHPTLTLEDYIHISDDGIQVTMDIKLEYVPAVEYFSNYKNSQTFLTVDFTAKSVGNKHTFQRCLSCYQTNREKEEKTTSNGVANARLKELYQLFDTSGITYNKIFFKGAQT